MATILIALPSHDFDPTEAGVPWLHLREAGHVLVFTTPNGKPAQADPRMLDGRGLGLLAPLLKADARGRAAHDAMAQSAAFKAPMPWCDASADAIDALILPGGHAKGMRPYLESSELQSLVSRMFALDKPVGAICHGTVLVARSKRADGRSGQSVLHGRRTTGLTQQLEMTAWWLTRWWLGDYYRTYAQTVQAEVTAALASPKDFLVGPPALQRDSPARLRPGFVVRDGHYLSARWPGDAHCFAKGLAAMLTASREAAATIRAS